MTKIRVFCPRGLVRGQKIRLGDVTCKPKSVVLGDLLLRRGKKKKEKEKASIIHKARIRRREGELEDHIDRGDWTTKMIKSICRIKGYQA